jgi:hypothetical protein
MSRYSLPFVNVQRFALRLQAKRTNSQHQLEYFTDFLYSPCFAYEQRMNRSIGAA